MRDDHPLAGRETIAPEEMVAYPLILPLRERVRNEILNWMKQEEKNVTVPLSYTLLSNAALMVEAGSAAPFAWTAPLPSTAAAAAVCSDYSGTHDPQCAGLEENHLFSPATSLFIQEIHMLRAKIE